MIKPTIHRNGSSRASLLEGYKAAAAAVRAAIDALAEVYPNGRDYYPQGALAINEARSEHDARLKALIQIRADMQALVRHVASEGEE